MAGKRRVDMTHPDSQEYTRKFTKLWDEYRELEKRERAKYPDWRGKDHPADAVLRPAYRKCCEETKALQHAYAHIFVEEPLND